MRLVFISDTHSLHGRMAHPVPDGDVLIHCGDFCGRSTLNDVSIFSTWFSAFPHPHKVLIAGNHDWPLANDDWQEAEARLSEFEYLHDTSVTIDGVKFYGSPYQPEFFNWAFNLPRGEPLALKWAQIPEDTNVLLTHGPPHGILDECPAMRNRHQWVHVGCEELDKRVQQLPELKVHAFGHIHEGSGVTQRGNVTYVNASICDDKYRPWNPPRVVEV
jgi:Icc-related predicted phosphoesterase